MHYYSVSPDINNRGTFDDEFDEWRFGCFKSKWDKHREEEEWEDGAVISPNQIEPYPSMFEQFIIEDLGRDPKTFDLEKFWLFDYHYASGDKKEECGSTFPIFMNKYD